MRSVLSETSAQIILEEPRLDITIISADRNCLTQGCWSRGCKRYGLVRSQPHRFTDESRTFTSFRFNSACFEELRVSALKNLGQFDLVHELKQYPADSTDRHPWQVMQLLTMVFTYVVESSATKGDVSLGRDNRERDHATSKKSRRAT